MAWRRTPPAPRRTAPARPSLRPDRLTVLLNGYSERRLPLLRAVVGAYATHPLVLTVVVLLWCNPSTPDRLLCGAAGGFPPGVTLRHAASASLNARFLLWPCDIRTAAVADDDVLPDAAALSFAFAAWQQHSVGRTGAGPLIGFFPRSHYLDLARGRWAYAGPQPGRSRSMVLTKFMLLRADLLHKYSCSPELAAACAVWTGSTTVRTSS
ncbi:hypothetical protein PVAP13_9KG251000 [Panicum virgatum]|uniref:Glycosyl transferase 64 domain-containing protein n=1 Tax=Panicum virgatum TaxID=38727 RepID=A0A8T0NJ94_PANVG|nr:hypothetical protein PVAP13_9KG251000 [Panicum virgatum]